MKKISFAALLISSLLLVACGSTSSTTSEIKDPIDLDLYSRALESVDEELCKTMSTNEAIQTCMSGVKDKVIQGEAVAEVNLEKCNSISDARIKELCNSEVQEMINFQNKQQLVDEATDLKEKALLEGNVDLCNQISNENVKESCINTYYLNEADSKKDPKICENIIGQDLIDQCKTTIQTTF